jgi:hypothetical protein
MTDQTATEPPSPQKFVFEQQRSAIDLEETFELVLQNPEDVAARAHLASALQGIATLLDAQWFASPPPSIDVPGRLAENLRLIQHQMGFASQERLVSLAESLRSEALLDEEDKMLLVSLLEIIEEEAMRGAFAMLGIP